MLQRDAIDVLSRHHSRFNIIFVGGSHDKFCFCSVWQGFGFDMSNASANTTKEKCNGIFWNLLNLNELHTSTDTDYVFEFQQVERCHQWGDERLADATVDMKKYMDDYAPKGAFGRVMDGTTNNYDDVWTERAVNHYHDYQRDILLNSLSFSSRFYYHTWWRVERTVAAAGLLCAGAGLSWRGKNYWALRQSRQAATASETTSKASQPAGQREDTCMK